MKKLLSIVLSILMVVTMIPMAVMPASAAEASDSVSYVDYTWNEESKTLSSETKSVDTYTEITSTTTEMTSGWYVVNGEVTVAERMTATGEVHLILADGAHLTASLGITVNEGNSLYIYGQSSDENTMGKLTATTTTTDYDAAIGGLQLHHAGTIVINGGNINASASKQGAGIGSGASCGGYQITINAGVVTATSSSSPAAIGSGNNRGSGVRGTVHSICINGGVVNATSSGAAIGGGSLFDGGDITITGGTVTATSVYQGAAIGGGYCGSGGNITITGGNVTATYTHTVYNGVAIGAGYNGESAGNILITGGTVTATSKRGCGIGVFSGNNGRIVILGGTVNASGSGTVHIKAGASGSMMLVDGTTVTISGDFTLQTDFVLPEGYTLKISEGATLTIPEGVTLTLPEEYTLVSNGTVNAVGTVNCITHKYVEGVCICGLECSHVGGTPTCMAPAVCTTCGTGYGEVDPTNHNWENGVCTYGCNTIHEPHDWSGKDGICTVCGATCTHTGGTATCKKQAVCDICGTSYGELADHTGGTATCQTQAVCKVCEESYGELDPNNHEYEKNNGFCCETYQPAELNENGYYEISNAGQLFWYANYINTVDRTANAVLTSDIDLENRPWTPIGSTGENSNNFRGIFDGQNYTIRGLYVEGGRAGLGFFGEVRTGTVKNFTIYGEVVANTEVDYVGGVIGSVCGVNGENDLERNGAIIQNITSYVNLTAKAHGVGKIGGFVGYANHQSLIENCSWYGTFDAGKYRVDSGAGGFIGKIQENTSEVTIRNCGAYGTIKTNYAGDYNNTATIYMGGFLSFSNTNAKTTLENCLFAGKFERGENLTDEAFLGAFGTLRSVNAIKNCYYLGDDGLEAVHSDSNLKPGSDNVEIIKVTEEQLKSGEVAYKLQEANEIWGQSIGTDAYPVLGGEEVYYGYTACDDEAMVYTNDSRVSATKPDHSWGEGVLTRPTKTQDGYYTYTCSACGETKTEPVERAANYDEYEKALNDLRAYLDSDMLTDENKGYISEWLATYDTDEAFSFIAGEEETLQMYIDATAYYASEFEAAIADCLAGNHSGNGDYCEVCGAYIHECDFSGEWKYDADKHWKECTCGLLSEEGTHTGGEATCTEKAVCETCGESYGEVDADNHDIVIDEAVAPDCVNTGLTEGEHCTRCDYKVAQEVVPALKHKDTLVQVDEQAPTCTENGWDAYEYCTACDYTTYVEKEALDHDIIIDEAVAPKCNETGLTAGQHCSRCDAMTIIQEVVPALNHKDTLVQVEAKAKTCTEAGYEAYEYCTACDYTTYKEIPASHNIVNVDAKAATCTEAGHEAYEYCTECDYTTYKEIPASHNIVNVDAKAATCTEAGHEAYEYCTACDYTTYKEIPATKHTEETVKGYAATCTKAGLTDGVKCSACGETLTAQKAIAKLAHKDSNGDYKCDYGCGHEFEKPAEPKPDTPDEPSDGDCGHLCHKTGFMGFIWKIVRFFWKLFKMNPVCECGKAHY